MLQGVSKLKIAQLGEQAAGQHQVDHYPGGQRPDPALQRPGPGECVITGAAAPA
jgi:hypothetical protein